DEPPVQHQAPAHAGGDDHAKHVPAAPPGTPPVLAHRHADGVVVQPHRDAGKTFPQPIPQREGPPRRNVQRRDPPGRPLHRPPPPPPPRGGPGLWRPAPAGGGPHQDPPQPPPPPPALAPGGFFGPPPGRRPPPGLDRAGAPFGPAAAAPQPGPRLSHPPASP